MLVLISVDVDHFYVDHKHASHMQGPSLLLARARAQVCDVAP